jgi:hypothetical protein
MLLRFVGLQPFSTWSNPFYYWEKGNRPSVGPVGEIALYGDVALTPIGGEESMRRSTGATVVP